MPLSTLFFSTIKKQYSTLDKRYINFQTFVIIDKSIDYNKQDTNVYNEEGKKFTVYIKSTGSIKSNKLLSRFANILYIKLCNISYDYVEKNDILTIVQSTDYIRILLLNYLVDNKIDCILKRLYNDNILCENIKIEDLDKIIKIIKKDIIKLISVLNNISEPESEKNIMNNIYALGYIE